MKKRSAALLVLLVSTFVALLLLFVLPAAQRTAPGVTANGPPSGAAPVLTDMQRIEDLQTRFNQDAGAPRLILLLSPT